MWDDQEGTVIPAHIGYGGIVPSLSVSELIRLKDEGYDIDACECGVAWADEFPFISLDKTATAYYSLREEVRGAAIAGSDSHDDIFVQALTLMPKGITLNQAIEEHKTTPIFTGIKGRKRLGERLNFVRKCIQDTAILGIQRAHDRLEGIGIALTHNFRKYRLK